MHVLSESTHTKLVSMYNHLIVNLETQHIYIYIYIYISQMSIPSLKLWEFCSASIYMFEHHLRSKEIKTVSDELCGLFHQNIWQT